MNESKFQSNLIKDLNNYGWFYNTNDRFRAGIPDVLGCYRGIHIAIEVKVDSNTVTPLQKFELRRISESGGVACVARYRNTTKIYSVTHNTQTFETANMKEITTWILELSLSNIKKNVMTA